MKFEWDEAKRRENLRKHGVDFSDCPEAMLSLDSVTLLDDRGLYEEIRFRTYAWLEDQLILIAHTEINEIIRIISARKARNHEQKTYFEYFGKRS